jgi:hypothetical protein
MSNLQWFKNHLKRGRAPLALGILAAPVAWICFTCAAQGLINRVQASGYGGRLHDLRCHHIPLASVLIGVSVMATAWLLRRVTRKVALLQALT